MDCGERRMCLKTKGLNENAGHVMKLSDAEQKRSHVDDMIHSRIESSGETEAEAIQRILALVANLPDDTSMLVNPDGTSVDARTIRVWASFHRIPEGEQ